MITAVFMAGFYCGILFAMVIDFFVEARRRSKLKRAARPTCYGTFNAMHQRCDQCEAKDTCEHEHKEGEI